MGGDGEQHDGYHLEADDVGAGGPRNDHFHDYDGRHRTTPPPSWGGTAMTWHRDMRLHRESHGMARYVARLLKLTANG